MSIRPIVPRNRRLPSTLVLAACAAGCAASPEPAPTALHDAVVEASCGQCRFGMTGDGCDLAIRLEGRAYFVDGTGIDDHGDAHAADGLCNAVRRARVTGTIAGDRFAAESLVLLPE